MKRFIIRNINTVVFYTCATVFAVFFMIPLWMMLVGAFSTTQGAYSSQARFFPDPVNWNWDNMVKMVKTPAIGVAFLNTIKLSLSAIPLIFFSALGAFGLARLRAPGKDFIFVGILAVMMLPWVVTLIPSFLVYSHLEWLNTFLPFYLPTIAGSAFFIFLLRQFMRSIPRDFDESARIDGCSSFRIFWNIILPLCKPSLAAVTIFAFIDRWNDYMGPLIYLRTANNFTLSLAIMNLRYSKLQMTYWEVIMFTTLFATVPLIIIFFCLQKYIVKGVVMSGIKG